jgi:PAS domain S-box-containing protein
MHFMADVMPQIVWTAKADGTLDYFNKRTLEFTGKTIEELEAWGWINAMHPHDQEMSMQKWKKALEDKVPFEIENRIQATDGKYYWHLNRGVPQLNKSGEIACWVGTATNIDQQKRNEEILEKTVAERTEELRIANESLVQSNHDLEQFAGFASHDLQAPLKTISMYLSMLYERNKDVLDESSLGYISKATAASQRMRTLVQTLLQFSKVNASQTNLADVDLNNVIHVIRNIMLDSSEPGSVVITNNTPHKLYADESMITQVLQNIIANGIKYNENDVAEITIESFENENEIVISVTDNGIGIAEEHIEKIFNVFTRLTSDSKGTGLGLSISKRIVEKHKGTIAVTSTVGKGTTFTLKIPKA